MLLGYLASFTFIFTFDVTHGRVNKEQKRYENLRENLQ